MRTEFRQNRYQFDQIYRMKGTAVIGDTTGLGFWTAFSVLPPAKAYLDTRVLPNHVPTAVHVITVLSSTLLKS